MVKLEKKIVEIFCPGLFEEVNKYLSKKTHKDFVKPFGGVNYFEVDDGVNFSPRSMAVVPKGLNEEDLKNPDIEFNKGLLEIGEKHGVTLRLPYWAYEE